MITMVPNLSMPDVDEGLESVAPDTQSVTGGSPQAEPIEVDDRWRAKAQEAERHRKEAEKAAKAEKLRAEAAERQLQDLKAQALGQSNKEVLQFWEEAKASNSTLQARIDELERELAQERAGKETERLKLAAMARLSEAGARKPDQLLRLLGEQLVEHHGEPAVIHGGVEVPLPRYLATLKQPESGWEHHFLPTAKKGMGVPAMAGTPAGPDSNVNPYAPDTTNLTMQLMLEATQPDVAAALKAEAGLG
jgi:hypothetical protein